MKFLQSNWLLLLIVLLVIIGILKSITYPSNKKEVYPPSYNSYNNEWEAPNEKTIPYDEEGELIRYGENLIAQTSVYLGPKGIIAPVSNGMNCQNCHLNKGQQSFSNSFSAVAATYPKYRDRSGRLESIEFRINDCLERSLNGKKIDSLSKEMRAMVSYIKWLGNEVPKGVKPVGSGLSVLPFLPRAADTAKGKAVYIQKCVSCHGTDGEGVYKADSVSFTYPPLWGKNSYNTGAGLYRLSQFAAYVKYNMPFGTTYYSPQLTDEQAWDVAAYVNSQPRPQKVFSADWPDIKKKPVDFPFGPYADSFSETQHKYGPFTSILKK